MFTDVEITFTQQLFARQTVSILDPKGEEICRTAKSVIQKLIENKEKENGEQHQSVQGSGSNGDPK